MKNTTAALAANRPPSTTRFLALLDDATLVTVATEDDTSTGTTTTEAMGAVATFEIPDTTRRTLDDAGTIFLIAMVVANRTMTRLTRGPATSGVSAASTEALTTTKRGGLTVGALLVRTACGAGTVATRAGLAARTTTNEELESGTARTTSHATTDATSKAVTSDALLKDIEEGASK